MHIETYHCDKNNNQYQQHQDLETTDKNLKYKDGKQENKQQMNEKSSPIIKQQFPSEKIKDEVIQRDKEKIINNDRDRKYHRQARSLSPCKEKLDKKLDSIISIIDKSHSKRELDTSFIRSDIKIRKEQSQIICSINDQKLSEPLPLLDKGKYSELYDQKPKPASNQNKTSNQINIKKKKKKSMNQNQEQSVNTNDEKRNKIQKQRVLKYVPDHECIKISEDQDRCDICYGTMSKNYFTKNTEQSIKVPFEICYADYIPTFIKKMDIQIREKIKSFKKFLQLSSLQDMKQYVYYIMNRASKYTGNV